MHVISDITLQVTAERRLLIRSVQLEKDRTVIRMSVESPARQWKWHLLFDLIQ